MKILASLFFPPVFSLHFYTIWWRNFLEFKNNYVSFLFWGVLEPLFILLAIGFGVGSQVSQIDGQGFFYYFFPGFLANTALILAFIETLYGSQQRLKGPTYESALRGLLSSDDLIIGEMAWAVTKSNMAILFFLGMGYGVGYFNFVNMAVTGLLLIFGSFIGAALGILMAMVLRHEWQFAGVFSIGMIPLALLTGALFPLSILPIWAQNVLFISPHIHLIEATRQVSQGQFESDLFLRLSILFLISVLFLNLASSLLRQRN